MRIEEAMQQMQRNVMPEMFPLLHVDFSVVLLELRRLRLRKLFIMAALCNRAGHYIFAL